MGSSSSKTRRIGGEDATASSYCSSSSSCGSNRRKDRGIFSSSCLGSSSTAYHSDDDDDVVDQVSDHHDQVNGTRVEQIESEANEVKVECYQSGKIDAPDDVSGMSTNVEPGEWANSSIADNVTRAGGSSSQAFSGRSLNRSGRFLSRFSFVPGSVSFRLSRAASMGSSRAYPSSPASFAISSAEEDHLCGRFCGLTNRNENRFSGHLNTSSFYSASMRSHSGENSAAPTFSSSLQNDQIVSVQDLAANGNDNVRTGRDASFPPFGSHMDIESVNRRPGDRRNGYHDSGDRNVRFSRTLSVGRLRDRVLRRSSFSDLTLSPLQQERITTSNESSVDSLISSPYPLRGIPHSFFASQNNDVDTLHPREGRHHDLLEHRSTFLERRRRIRSQVRALQRLGSRFENLSGHERYCVLSGQHRTGRCSCRIGTRDSNPNDDGGARASISRIVMLAEALFEVLDEIHQQSVVLSSRPSVSSIGSVPAPNEVVESLPVKVYDKPTKFQCEEVAQCYICLVEYEEGDEMRILPCHHEFHKKCIDKWLKEIHRVCPLCRGDICRPDLTSVESYDGC